MKNRLLYIWILLWSLPAWGQVVFDTRVSRKEISTDDRLRVDFVLNRTPEHFTPPAFKDFYVVMGPMQSERSQTTFENGRYRRQHEFAYSYVLAPRRAGTLHIEPAEAVVDGRTYRTRPVTVNVSRATSAPAAISSHKPGNQAPKDVPQGKDVFIRLELSSRNPYVGQGISALYKLYIKEGIRVADFGQTNISEPKGFWAEVIKDEPVRLGTTEINGQTYRVYALRQMLLIPQHAGKLEITPQKIEMIIVKRVLRQMGPFQMYDEEPEHIYLSTPRTVVKVKPLPEKGKPVDFSGAVGQFSFFVNVSDTLARTGQDLTVEVKVTGKGNLNMFDLPRPVFPPEWEVYDPEHKVHTKPAYTGYRGFVSDIYTVIPQKPGKYTLPPVSFSYFDPVDEQYKRISSPALNFEITGSMLTGNSPAAGPGPGEGFSEIKTHTHWQAVNGQAFWQKSLFSFLLWLPFLLFLLILAGRYAYRRWQPDAEKTHKERQNRYIKSLLKDARKHFQEPSVFYGLLEKALREYFKNRLDLDTASLHFSVIDRYLTQRNVPDNLRSQLETLWQHIHTARYAPSGSSDTRQDYEQLKNLLEKLDKILKK